MMVDVLDFFLSDGSEEELFLPASDADETSEVDDSGLDAKDGRAIDVRCRTVPGEVEIRRIVVGDWAREGRVLDEGRGGESSARAESSSGAERLDILQPLRDESCAPFQLLRSADRPPSRSSRLDVGGLRSVTRSWLLRYVGFGAVGEDKEGKP